MGSESGQFIRAELESLLRNRTSGAGLRRFTSLGQEMAGIQIESVSISLFPTRDGQFQPVKGDRSAGTGI